MAHPSTAAAQQRIEQMLAGHLPPSIRDFVDFEHWLEQLRQLVFVSVTHLYHEVGDELDVERKRVRQEENSARKVWDLVPDEGVQLLKSTASIRSKIGRDLCDREDAGKPLPGDLSLDVVEKLVLGLPDLGRFRIVADYSHDVLRALRVLVPTKREGLLGRYPIKGKIKDYVFDLDLRHPGRGHRARQFAVKVQERDRSIHIEVQLMTLLQHAWDRRNHPMYEWTREGGELSARLRINDVALAETLHLVDEQASANWKRFLRQKGRAPSRKRGAR